MVIRKTPYFVLSSVRISGSRNASDVATGSGAPLQVTERVSPLDAGPRSRWTWGRSSLFGGRGFFALRPPLRIEPQQPLPRGCADPPLGDQPRHQPRRRDIEGVVAGRAAE